MSFSWHVSKSGLLTLQHSASSRLKRLVPPDRYLGGVSESAWEIEASVSRLGNARVEYRPSTQGTHARHGAAVLALTPACAVKGIPPVSTADAVAALPAVGERSQQHDEKAREHRGSASEVTRTRTLCHTHLRVDGRDTRSREQSEVLGLGVLELRGRREPISAVLAVSGAESPSDPTCDVGCEVVAASFPRGGADPTQ